MILFVLTAERYHEASDMLGVFTDRAAAVAAFLDAAARGLPRTRSGHTYVCNWDLSSWDDGGRLRRSLVIFAHEERSLLGAVAGVPLVEVLAKEGQQPSQSHYEPVDPLTFAW